MQESDDRETFTAFEEENIFRQISFLFKLFYHALNS